MTELQAVHKGVHELPAIDDMLRRVAVFVAHFELLRRGPEPDRVGRHQGNDLCICDFRERLAATQDGEKRLEATEEVGALHPRHRIFLELLGLLGMLLAQLIHADTAVNTRVAFRHDGDGAQSQALLVGLATLLLTLYTLQFARDALLPLHLLLFLFALRHDRAAPADFLTTTMALLLFFLVLLFLLLHGLQDALLERAVANRRLGIGNLNGHRERRDGHDLDCLDCLMVLRFYFFSLPFS